MRILLLAWGIQQITTRKLPTNGLGIFANNYFVEVGFLR